MPMGRVSSRIIFSACQLNACLPWPSSWAAATEASCCGRGRSLKWLPMFAVAIIRTRRLLPVTKQASYTG